MWNIILIYSIYHLPYSLSQLSSHPRSAGRAVHDDGTQLTSPTTSSTIICAVSLSAQRDRLIYHMSHKPTTPNECACYGTTCSRRELSAVQTRDTRSDVGRAIPNRCTINHWSACCRCARVLCKVHSHSVWCSDVCDVNALIIAALALVVAFHAEYIYLPSAITSAIKRVP